MQMQDENQAILEHFAYVLPHLNDMLTSDCSVGLSDLEKQILYVPSKTLDLKIPKDTPLKPGSGMYRAIHEQRHIVAKMDKSLWGVPFIAVANPIYNSRGEIIGAVVVNETVDRQDNLKQMANALADSMASLSGTVQEISAQSEEISAVSTSTLEFVKESVARVGETDEVLALIRRIANQTNLLGLNAAIEAARVGEQGRGFGVVANEIRKLAHESADSIKKIEAILKAIQASSSETATQMVQIEAAIGQVAEAIGTIATAAQQANTVAIQLDTLADDLSKDTDK